VVLIVDWSQYWVVL